ncbi:hypothetical protein ACRB68_55340 [Actinomadura sp. RB68]|uniref:HTH cro/C1-type domain-containing protein n=2 Tax=Actinomadura macrotermitis TaxID=2585200 RepID=A0A7K0C3P9_9ACTN|nr:hypothetical protein [Actinomadura macrotermitis]
MELRRLRIEAGLSQRRASILLDRSPSSISHLENGLCEIRPRELDFILRQCNQPEGAFKEAMLELARDGRKKGWWRSYTGVLSPEHMDFISLEDDARHIRTYETLIIPGLLQTPMYAQAVFRDATPSIARGALKVRLARQSVIHKPHAPQLDVIISEAALRQMAGGSTTMQGQLDHLITVSERTNVNLRTLPLGIDFHPGLLGPFTMLEIGTVGKLTVVMIEDHRGMSYVEDGDEVRGFARVFTELNSLALDEVDSRTLIQRLRSEI